jgi:hypothetical protein
MTTKRAIKSRPDGGVDITIPAPQYVQQLMREQQITEDQAVALIIERDAPGAEIVEASDIPSDRRYRNCWCKSGKAIAVDMPKARQQFMAELREQRNKDLSDSDVLMTRATEQGKTTEAQALKQARQALRDLPATMEPLVDACQSVADLDQLAAERQYGVAPLATEADKMTVSPSSKG